MSGLAGTSERYPLIDPFKLERDNLYEVICRTAHLGSQYLTLVRLFEVAPEPFLVCTPCTNPTIPISSKCSLDGTPENPEIHVQFPDRRDIDRTLEDPATYLGLTDFV